MLLIVGAHLLFLFLGSLRPNVSHPLLSFAFVKKTEISGYLLIKC
uniref:Uncharacterized protein n=1 Tax=Arundo donax TaxID=35708 RepID=A0A0A9E6W8_ARUDO